MTMPKPTLPPDTIKGLQELSFVLRGILTRLKKEGYVLQNGQLIAPAN